MELAQAAQNATTSLITPIDSNLEESDTTVLATRVAVTRVHPYQDTWIDYKKQ